MKVEEEERIRGVFILEDFVTIRSVWHKIKILYSFQKTRRGNLVRLKITKLCAGIPFERQFYAIAKSHFMLKPSQMHFSIVLPLYHTGI